MVTCFIVTPARQSKAVKADAQQSSTVSFCLPNAVRLQAQAKCVKSVKKHAAHPPCQSCCQRAAVCGGRMLDLHKEIQVMFQITNCETDKFAH